MTPHAQVYREIKLTKGYVALVDAKNYDRLVKHKWSAMVKRGGQKVYAFRQVKRDDGSGRRRTIYMHREVIFAPPGTEVDHRVGIGLDNREDNLRVCNRQQNSCNRGKPLSNTSGFKGVCWDKSRDLYTSGVVINGRRLNLGRFTEPEKASAVYEAKARELFGEFARI